MLISLNEIRSRALQFANEWKDAGSEKAEAQTFWNEFFEVFGISRRRVASFEKPVVKSDGQGGFIDLLWKGNCLVEHKSRGKDLDRACKQAFDYFPGLAEAELPRYVIVSDFARIRLYDLDEGGQVEFQLKDLAKQIQHFGFISGYQKRTYKEEDPVNIQAAELMGRFHDALKAVGYRGHALEVYLVRLVFCLFADDTGIFEKDSFQQYLEQHTRQDGSDLATHLAQLFQVLNTPEERRYTTLDEMLTLFPYVNGKLFEEALPIASFNSAMRGLLIECCYLDWGKISPAIFGSLFQSVMDPALRRNLGAHYTSEKNILKLIKPLFLDEMRAEFDRIKNNPNRLREFHQRLSTLRFMDPACGCGNFLVVSYRELRLLELDILRALFSRQGQRVLNIRDEVWVDVDQFYGIEIEEFPARIAETALWLVDHQMNMRISEEFGQYFARLPLKKSPGIIHGNALQIDWKTVIAPKDLSYILGNPPFVGKHLQDPNQKREMTEIFHGVQGAGNLDYVSAWYIKAAQYIEGVSHIKVSFVSTNSITQGEQVGVLWKELFEKYHIKIHFAHRTFKWTNEARGRAGVFVVIIGFSNFDVSDKYIWEYEHPNSEAQEICAGNISPYLVDGDDLVVLSRTKPICAVPGMLYGSKPVDDGNLFMTDEEKNELVRNEPGLLKFIRPILSAKEFLNNQKRWCFWLKDVNPTELRNFPDLVERIKKVKEFRLKSPKKPTQEAAMFPSLFAEIRQPDSDYVLIPRHSSENRSYIPFGFFDSKYIVSDSCACIPDATLYHFGVLTSAMHMAWVKYVCGKLEGRYRYSNNIVYNNFPWPKEPGAKQIGAVESAAQGVLDARGRFADSSLADLYDPLTMPPALLKAHKALDRAVDLCYRRQTFTTEANRIEFLFGLYADYTAPLIGKGEKRRRR